MPVSLKTPRLFHLCSCPAHLHRQSSLWVSTMIDPALSPPWERRQCRVSAMSIASCLYHFTAYHRGHISEVRLYCRVLCFKRTCARTLVDKVPSLFAIVWVSRTGREERSPGCEERLFEMLLRCQGISVRSRLSLGLKDYLFKNGCSV